MHDSNPSDDMPRPLEPSLAEALEGEPPRFGAVDIVEAFTAMRHEWRGQTRETRALAERLQSLGAGFEAIESKLLAALAERSRESADDARPLALLVADIDHQLSRAIAALTRWEADQRQRAETEAEAVAARARAMGPVARWFARPLLTLLDTQAATRQPHPGSPALEGLNLLLARLRRLMRDQGIERVDVAGAPFDPSMMHAIGNVATAVCPAGHVAEQLSPAYRWRGKLVRFADVRVAN